MRERRHRGLGAIGTSGGADRGADHHGGDVLPGPRIASEALEGPTLATDTELMIAPGHAFRHVGGLMTSFHLPIFTLLAQSRWWVWSGCSMCTRRRLHTAIVSIPMVMRC